MSVPGKALPALLLVVPALIIAAPVAAKPQPGQCIISYAARTTTIKPVTFSDTDPIGTSIPVADLSHAGEFPGLHCQSYTGAMIYIEVGRSPGGGEQVVSRLKKGSGDTWESGIPGIGIRMYYRQDGRPHLMTSPVSPTARYSRPIYHGHTNTSFTNMSLGTAGMELVKTGPIAAPGETRTIHVYDKKMSDVAFTPPGGNRTQLIPVGFRVTGSGHLTLTVKVLATTCSFQSNTVTFPLGGVGGDEIPDIGAGSPWVGRSLVSNGCPGVTRVKMNFQGTATGAGNTLFAVTGGAKGVGVHLQRTDDGADAVPNSPAPMVWAPRAAGGTFDFRARYVRTAQSITPGPANSTITVNLTYE